MHENKIFQVFPIKQFLIFKKNYFLRKFFKKNYLMFQLLKFNVSYVG